MLGEEPAGEGDRIEIRWGSVVTKSATSIKDAQTTHEAGMKANQIGVVFEPPEGTTDVVVTKEDIRSRICDSEVIKPLHKKQFGRGKSERGLGKLGSPIVDGEAPDFWAEGAVENGAGVLKGGLQVYHPLRGGMGME